MEGEKVSINFWIPVKVFQYFCHIISKRPKKNHEKSNPNNWINDGKKLTKNSFWENVSITNGGHYSYGEKQCFLECPIIIPSIDIAIIINFFDTLYNVFYQFRHLFFCLQDSLENETYENIQQLTLLSSTSCKWNNYKYLVLKGFFWNCRLTVFK